MIYGLEIQFTVFPALILVSAYIFALALNYVKYLPQK